MLNSYESVNFEYHGFPRMEPTLVSNGEVGAGQSRENLLQEDSTNEQLFVTRVDAMASVDSEYVLLKTLLSINNTALFRSAGQKWQRVLTSMRADRRLTSLEQAIVDLAQIEDVTRRAEIEQGLKRLLFFLMQIRQVDGKNLMLHIGYYPPEFCNVTDLHGDQRSGNENQLMSIAVRGPNAGQRFANESD